MLHSSLYDKFSFRESVMNDMKSSPLSNLIDFSANNMFVRAAAHDRMMDSNSLFKANYMGNEFDNKLYYYLKLKSNCELKINGHANTVHIISKI